MLAGSGASLGLAIWGALQGSALAAYLADNDRGAVASGAALPSMLAGAGLVLGAAWLKAGAAKARRAPALHRLAVRCLPLMLSALLPPLWQWRPWVEQPLGFLGLLALIAIALRKSLSAALLPASDAPDGAGAVAHVAAPTALRARAPLTIVVAAVAAYAAYFGYYSVQHHHNLRTNSYDLGIFDNVLWNAADRYSFSLPASPTLGPDARHLGQHATFIALAVAPIYGMLPRAETALWMQSVIVALAALPLFVIARRRLGAWSACLIAVGYLLYPPVHGPNLYDFHFIMFGPFFLWTSVMLLEARRDFLAAPVVVLSLLVREDIAAGVAMIGAYLIMTRQRPRAGLVLALLGCVYVGVVKLIIMPGGIHGGGSFVEIYRGLLPKDESGFGAVLGTVATNPAFTWKTLLTYDKLVYVLQLATPLALLPWLRPIGWVFSLPGLLFCLLVTHALPLIQISFHYTPHWTTYLFLALIVNVEWLGQQGATPAHGMAHKRAALATFALCMVLGSHQYGAIMQHNSMRAGFGPFVFGSTDAQRADYEALVAMIAQVPKDARIVASESLVPHVSNRRYAYTLRMGVFDAEYLLATTDDPIDADRKALTTELRGKTFGVIDARRRFVLMRRGADSARNAGVRRALH